MSKYFSHINYDNITLNSEEYEIYAKHLIIPEIQLHGQQRLKQSRILSIGAGGLASASLLYLTSCGIGKIGIIDDDHIEKSNLHRQILYNNNDIGLHKGTCAKHNLNQLNEQCNIEIYNCKFNSINADRIVQQYDIILDNTDNFETRWLISIICKKSHKVHIYGAISTFIGQVSVFNYQGGPNYNDLNRIHTNNTNQNACNNNGVLGILPGIIGILQATEILKVILGLGEILSGYIVIYDILNSTFRKLSLRQRHNINIASQNYLAPNSYHSSQNQVRYISFNILYKLTIKNKPIYLIDIRDRQEHNVGHIYQSINIPFNKLKNNTNQKILQQRTAGNIVILYCNSSIRSRLASTVLLNLSINHFILNI
uniref:Molybdopterin biosynthesis protein n=1 Tax=Helminthora furcellata TaxID=1884666 RepID=A0A1G4NRH6_9FLOR|nr:Molybdopterin biosynthesis protein [Helminthora furcellata]SCW21224.1 Molybdopterin biosynthesis protein [Helminthora furcellata]SCW24084.1 Molybdopterin biosynthesis protein [Helminthora furcellata]